MYVVYQNGRVVGFFEDYFEAVEFADMREGAEIALEED